MRLLISPHWYKYILNCADYMTTRMLNGQAGLSFQLVLSCLLMITGSSTQGFTPMCRSTVHF